MTLAEEVSQQIEIRKKMFTTAEPGLRDFFGNLIDERSPKMTNEEIRNNLNLLTGNFEETARVASRALSLAAEGLDTFEQKAYDRGLNDCWEMVRRIHLNGDDVLWSEDLEEIFPNLINPSLTSILLRNTPQQALAKIRAWEEKKAEEERKKQEETEKIQIGDVVDCYVKDDSGFISNSDLAFIGIYCGEDNNYYWAINERNPVPQRLSKERWILKKTGEHVDILSVLKE